MEMNRLTNIPGFSVWRAELSDTIERGPPKDHPCQVYFNLVHRFQRKMFKCDLLSKYAKFA
jgi:hypothetical protein